VKIDQKLKQCTAYGRIAVLGKTVK